MNILYGIAFLALIYYLIQWKNITNNLKSKLIEQHSIINSKIQNHISKQISNDAGLLEGFTTTNTQNIFANLEVESSDERNNCNSMFLPSAYSGIYSNEIKEDLYNYSMMKKEINL